MDKAAFIVRWLFESNAARGEGAPGRLMPRWIFLRALGLIYFSAFFSLVFQIRGLIGPQGILPANQYLRAVAHSLGSLRFWYAPTMLWFSTGSGMLMALCWVGMLASLLVVFNVWPRATLAVCFVCYLSFVAAAGHFSGYQSDGMLLEAGLIALFFAPPGFWPGLGWARPPIRASLFLLQWEWFRIYFESGVAKLASGDPQWRHFTAMDHYYQNGPLPTWIGWYVEHLPHWFHAATVGATLTLELGLVFMLFFPRRIRIICFCIVTPWEIGVILTANYAFLNYLVLALGFLLLDDRVLSWCLQWCLPRNWRKQLEPVVPAVESRQISRAPAPAYTLLNLSDANRAESEVGAEAPGAGASAAAETFAEKDFAEERVEARRPRSSGNFVLRRASALGFSLKIVLLVAMFYVTAAQLVLMVLPWMPLPTQPILALQPFRIANRYGLFAVMTRGRYEIEFQGSQDGKIWTAYPYRYKPQDPGKAPGIYAPYQPRFDWNLWFASLGTWREYPMVPLTEERLLDNDPAVLNLFAGNPFEQQPPRMVRAMLWQYWFTSRAEKRASGDWWRRKLLGQYAPTLARGSDGQIGIVQ